MNDAATIKLTDGCAQVIGALTFDTVAKLRTKGNQFITTRKRLEFDFKDVTRCDSSALTLLTAWARLSRKNGKAIFFINLPQQLYDIAKISGLDKVLPIASPTS